MIVIEDDVIASTSQSVPILSDAEMKSENIQKCFINTFSSNQSKQYQIDALVHATSCPDRANCSFESCCKIKNMAKHSRYCELKSQGKFCSRCNYLKSLCVGHAEKCTETECRVMLCRKLKEESSTSISIRYLPFISLLSLITNLQLCFLFIEII